MENKLESLEEKLPLFESFVVLNLQMCKLLVIKVSASFNIAFTL